MKKYEKYSFIQSIYCRTLQVDATPALLVEGLQNESKKVQRSMTGEYRRSGERRRRNARLRFSFPRKIHLAITGFVLPFTPDAVDRRADRIGYLGRVYAK